MSSNLPRIEAAALKPLKERRGVPVKDVSERGRNVWRSFCLVAADSAWRVIVLSLLSMTSLWAQSQPQTESPRFEVASVKLNNAPDFRALQLQFLSGGRVVFKNAPLQIIFATAYNVPFQSPRITGGPEWEAIKSKAYDIEATAGEGAIKPGLPIKDRNNKLRLMLQSLLKERFKLTVRVEHKEQPVYALLVAKGGPKLEKARLQEKDCVEGADSSQVCHTFAGGGQGRGIHGDAVSIYDVALFVQNWTDRPIVDKTGLKDLYNVQTNGWRPMRDLTEGEGAPTPQGGDARLYDPERQTLSDVLSQLGLRMQSQRAVVDMFIVDHVEQPSEN